MLTRKADYAIRCIVHLASSPSEVIIINELAKKIKTPKSFLAKILQQLAKAGIVKSLRGIHGGFMLAKKPADITLFDVITTIDNSVAMNVCAIDKKACTLSNSCAVHPIWVEIKEYTINRLKSWNFAELAATERKLKKINPIKIIKRAI